MSNKVTKRGYTENDAAEYLGISVSVLRNGRRRRFMDGETEGRLIPPPHIKAGKKVLYMKDDLDKWLENHRVANQGYINESEEIMEEK